MNRTSIFLDEAALERFVVLVAGKHAREPAGGLEHASAASTFRREAEAGSIVVCRVV